LQLAAGTDTNSGIVLDLKDKNDKSLKTVTLGTMHMGKAPAIRSLAAKVRMAVMCCSRATRKTALLIADPLSNVEPKPEQWL